MIVAGAGGSALSFLADSKDGSQLATHRNKQEASETYQSLVEFENKLSE
jgi:hypothetical protein